MEPSLGKQKRVEDIYIVNNLIYSTPSIRQEEREVWRRLYRLDFCIVPHYAQTEWMYHEALRHTKIEVTTKAESYD